MESTQRKTLMNAIKPIVSTMKVYGIGISGSSHRLSHCCQFAWAITLCLLFFLTVLLAISQFSIVPLTAKYAANSATQITGEDASRMVDVVGFMQSFSILVIFTVKRKRLVIFTNELQDMTNQESTKSEDREQWATDQAKFNHLRKFSIWVIVVPFIYITAVTMVGIHCNNRPSLPEAHEEEPDDVDDYDPYYEDLIGTALFYIQWLTTLVHILSISFLSHGVSFVIVLLKIVKSVFDTLERDFSMSDKLAREEYDENQERWVRRFIGRHKRACQLVQKADDALSEVNFVCMAFEFTLVILMVRAVDIKAIQLVTLTHVGPLAFYLFCFLCRVLTSATVNNQVLTSLKPVLKVNFSDNQIDYILPETAQKIQDYADHVLKFPPNISGWHMFGVTSGCALTLAGYALTYTLTLYGIS